MALNRRVLVVDELTNEALYECDIEELELAYQRAGELEQMGLVVKVVAPSITQTLTQSLGLSFDEEEEYQNSVTAELEDHDGSCCATPATFDETMLQEAPEKLQ